MSSLRPLISKSFANQCLAFPDQVERMLAEVETVEQAKDMLDKAAAMQTYAERLKAGIDIERPIAIGVLKIKVKLGELMPATPKKQTGRGHKSPKGGLGLSDVTISAYRKLAKHSSKLDKYYESTTDVPSQTDFIRICTADIRKGTMKLTRKVVIEISKLPTCVTPNQPCSILAESSINRSTDEK